MYYFRSLRSSRVFSLLTFVALFLFGCGRSGISTATAEAAPPDNPSVEIFRPVPASNVKANDVHFADGCGFYLAFAICGQPDFGQTVPRLGFGRAEYELKLGRDLHLTRETAIRFAAITGGTVVGVAQVENASDGKLTLTYTLYDVSSGQPVGAPITATGTPANIVTELPRMAADMCRQLGVASPLLVKTGDLSAAQIATVGATLMLDSPPPFPADLRPAVATNAFIADLAIQFPGDREQHLETAERLVTRLSPWNTVAWCTIADVAPALLRKDSADIKARSDRHPKSAALAYVELYAAEQMRDHDRINDAQTRLLADAPQCPDAFTRVGAMLEEQAAALRGERLLQEMTAEENTQIHALYQQWESDEKRATALDPTHDFAWLQYADAAAMLHERDVFASAFKQAEQYTPDRYTLFDNGLNFCLPQWGPGPNDLATIADAAAHCKDYRNIAQVIDILTNLSEADLPPQCKTLADIYRSRFEAEMNKTPHDPQVLLQYGHFLLLAGDPDGKAVVLKAMDYGRNDDGVLKEGAFALTHSGFVVNAVPAFRVLAAHGDRDAELYAHLSNGLIELGNYDEAVKYAEQACTLFPTYAYGRFIRGKAYFFKHRYREAEDDMHYASMHTLPALNMYAIGTVSAAEQGKAEDAEAWAKASLDRYGDDGPKTHLDSKGYSFIHYAAADAHFASKRYPEAIEHLTIAISLNPAEGNLYLLYGDVYEAQGNRNAARKQWEIARGKFTLKDDLALVGKRLATYPASVVQALVETSQKTPQPWRWTLNRPATDDWSRPGFDVGSWSKGTGAFGSKGTPGIVIGTEWATPDIWIRREVTLPASFDPAKIKILTFYDEDPEFYINGILAARATGYVNDYIYLDLNPDARVQLVPGATVTLAAHGHNTIFGQGLDFGLYSVTGP